MRYIKDLTISTIISFVAVTLLLFIVAMWSQTGMIHDIDDLIEQAGPPSEIAMAAEQPLEEAKVEEETSDIAATVEALE